MDIYKFYGERREEPFLAISLLKEQDWEKYLGTALNNKDGLINVPEDLKKQDCKFFEVIIDAKTKEIREIRGLSLYNKETFDEAVKEAIKDNERMFIDRKDFEQKNRKPVINYETIQLIIDSLYLYGTPFEKDLQIHLKTLQKKYPIKIEYVKGDESDRNKAYRKVSIPKKIVQTTNV